MIVKFSKTFICIISTTSCSKHLIPVRRNSEFQTVFGNFERDRESKRESGYMTDLLHGSHISLQVCHYSNVNEL